MNIYIIHVGEVVSEQTSPFKTERKAALSYIQLAICGWLSLEGLMAFVSSSLTFLKALVQVAICWIRKAGEECARIVAAYLFMRKMNSWPTAKKNVVDHCWGPNSDKKPYVYGFLLFPSHAQLLHVGAYTWNVGLPILYDEWKNRLEGNNGVWLSYRVIQTL